jgi:hypothetical protein
MAGEIAARGRPYYLGDRKCVGYETLTLNDDAVHTLQSIPAGDLKPQLTVVRVRCAANASGGVSWRADGTPPTVTDGMPAEHLIEEGISGDPAKLKFIRLTADQVVLHVAYWF